MKELCIRGSFKTKIPLACMLLVVLLTGCKTLNVENEVKKNDKIAYYFIDALDNIYLRFEMKSDYSYSIVNNDCTHDQKWGLWKTIARNKLVLFEEDFEGTVYDTISIHSPRKVQIVNREYIRHKPNKQIRFKKKSYGMKEQYENALLETLFNCPDVVIPKRRILLKDSF